MDVIHIDNNIASYITQMREIMERMDIMNLNQYELLELITSDNYKNMYPNECNELLIIANEIDNYFNKNPPQ